MEFNHTQFMKLYNDTHKLMHKIKHKRRYERMNTLRNILYNIIIYLKVYKHLYPSYKISPLQAYLLYYIVAHPEYLVILKYMESVLTGIDIKVITKLDTIDKILEENIKIPPNIEDQMLEEQMLEEQMPEEEMVSREKYFSSLFTNSKAEPGAEALDTINEEYKGGKSRKRKSRRMRTRKKKERKSKKRNNRKGISKRRKTTRKKI